MVSLLSWREPVRRAPRCSWFSTPCSAHPSIDLPFPCIFAVFKGFPFPPQDNSDKLDLFANVQTDYTSFSVVLFFFLFVFFFWWLNSFVANPNGALHAYCIIYSSARTDSCIYHTLHPFLHHSAPWEWLVPMQKGQKTSGKPKFLTLDWAGGFTKGRVVPARMCMSISKRNISASIPFRL